MTELYQQVARAGNIYNFINISNFLNPFKELGIEDNLKTDLKGVLQDVILEHLGVEQADEDDEEEEQAPKPVYSIQAAQGALKLLINFSKGHDDIQTAHLRAIERLELELEALDVNTRVQATLDGWIM
jgi:hypothetical protein